MDTFNTEKIKYIFQHRKPNTVGEHKFFAVMVPLVENEEGELSLLYEIRGKNLTRQPGEICFPGGAMEEGETPLQCAFREAREELGMIPEELELVSKIDTLHTVSNFTIYCYLGILDGIPQNISEEEVEEIVCVPIKYLIDNPPEMHVMNMLPKVDESFPYEKIDFMDGYKWRTGKADIPIYQYKDKVIWGITARITHNFIRILEGEKK